MDWIVIENALKGGKLPPFKRTENSPGRISVPGRTGSGFKPLGRGGSLIYYIVHTFAISIWKICGAFVVHFNRKTPLELSLAGFW